MKKIYFLLITFFIFLGTMAQYSGNGGGSFNKTGGSANRGNLNIGHFYGKIVDDKKKGVAGVTVQLIGNKFDTATKQMKLKVVKTDITENNGDFDLDAISLFGDYKLKISSVGYKKIEMTVSFGLQRPTPGAPVDYQKIAAMADKDLGNIKLETDAVDLGNVTVTSVSKPVMEVGLDRKIFNVDKNLSSTGQTATEIMKSIPSLSVDIDGNVTMRNATPTIFVDGRPTTLTLDEIPSDIIDKVEIITNPSAKFDASGGGASILNIVLKKNKKNGYNGNVRVGIDQRGRANGGGDLNYRQNKINFTGSLNYNQRKSISTTSNNTVYYTTPINTNVDYTTTGTNDGHIGFYRAGIDYFADIRNTFSIAGNFAQGKFNNITPQNIDTSYGQTLSSYTFRNSAGEGKFQNVGGQLSYKHNFTKEGENITADANYNSITNSNYTNIKSQNYNQFGGIQKNPSFMQQSNGSGYNHYFTIQSDYENPITDDKKIEAGVRAAIRNFKTENYQYAGDSATTIPFSPSASSLYKYTDEVFAAYGTYSFKVKKLSLQFGLRAESSNYSGHLDSLPGQTGIKNTDFKVDYPISLFPSVYLTYKINDNQSLQLNYSRKINRPNFFQILPVYNFSDPQNPGVGNPNLKPEFANNLEWSYNNNYSRTDNFMATAYLKYATNLITSYIYKDVNKNLQVGASTSDSLFYTSYTNANYSYSYGLELTEKITVVKWWDLLLNFNLFNSKLSTDIPNETAVNNSLFSWFSKVNTTFKLGKGISLQFTWESRSKIITPQNGGGSSSGGGGGRSSGMFGGGPQTLAQGYTLPRYWDVDAAVRKDWTWKGGRGASLTLSVNNIFRTGNMTQAYSTYFSQYAERYRDPQLFRLNLSYRFGKVDISLFKRKNTKADQSGALEGMSN